MKKLVCILTVILLCAALCGCSGLIAYYYECSLPCDVQGQNMWSCKVEDESIAVLTQTARSSGTKNGQPFAQFTFTFESVAPGDTQVLFVYHPKGENTVLEAKKVTLHVDDSMAVYTK